MKKDWQNFVSGMYQSEQLKIQIKILIRLIWTRFVFDIWLNRVKVDYRALVEVCTLLSVILCNQSSRIQALLICVLYIHPSCLWLPIVYCETCSLSISQCIIQQKKLRHKLMNNFQQGSCVIFGCQNCVYTKVGQEWTCQHWTILQNPMPVVFKFLLSVISAYGASCMDKANKQAKNKIKCFITPDVRLETKSATTLSHRFLDLVVSLPYASCNFL